ncbi:Ig-like domain-containing protein [uncultured Methanobrevibacter sp.]|uniref:Ig-like domain-containing protein n=1 Tax=uncultured Methanobrevibacter sp. TaxID=253161 RepID=UPI00261748D6|nr:Ig-like domain-containing protein [uncultured Methanobrevibacter sp.]
MEKNHIIIIALLAVIALLVICLGALILQDLNKSECELIIRCGESMSNGETIEIKLIDLNKTPISDATVNVQLTNGNETKEYTVTTDNNGTGNLTLSDISDGEYSINCTFNGNDNYKPATASKKFNYTDTVSASGTSQGSSSNPIDENRPTNDINYKGYTPYHESEVTSDGWNPREHEVSRRDMGDGSQEIRYDDGYYRLVDENGYVITYGYR